MAEPMNPDRNNDWPDWPSYALVDDLLPTLERWSREGRRYALATLISVDGSSPRPVGSEMAVAEDGEIAGYVSGGCVEAAVAAEAIATLQDGKPRLLDYGAGSPVLDLRLSCGGRIGILVRPMADGAAHAARLRAARRQRDTLIAITELETGAMRYLETSDAPVSMGLDESGQRYCKHYFPPLRLVMVGHDPTVLSVLALAPLVSIETVLLRPLGPELDASVTPPSVYDRRPINSALADLKLDDRCAVYTLSHDAETDHAVMVHGLRSPAFCIGALGSRRKAEMRLARLRELGFDDASLKRLHTPAGLDIGARTPQEIALSIIAQVVAERGRR